MLKTPIKLADSSSLNRLSNSVNIASDMRIAVNNGYILEVKQQGVEVSGGNDPYDTEAYMKELTDLDQSFRDVIDHADRKEIIVGDRFPFLYFVKEYGLAYDAAFPGCAKDTEADPKTIAFLIDKVKADQIPVIFHIELSNQQMSRSIAEATGAKERQLNSIHNVTQKDFDAGVTYVDLMKRNVKTLKEACKCQVFLGNSFDCR